MRYIYFGIALLILIGCSETQKIPEFVELNTWQDSVSYSYGYDVGKRFKDLDLEYNIDDFNKGFLQNYYKDTSYAYGASLATNILVQGIEVSPLVLLNGIESAFNGDSLILSEKDINNIIIQYSTHLQIEKENRARNQILKNQNEGKDFIEKYKNDYPDYNETESGLVYRIIKEGYGNVPIQTDTVIVHYVGKLIDGTIFDSSLERGEPTSLSVDAVIKGWQEALKIMKVGSKWELVIPSELGYGKRKSGKIPAGSTLVFEIELLGLE